MGECFEITLFTSASTSTSNVAKCIQGVLSGGILEGKGKSQNLQRVGEKDVFFDVIENIDFVEHIVALENLSISKRNFDRILTEILRLVETCFSTIPEILFATGLYELTGYYLKNATYLSDIPKVLFPNAPLLIFRPGFEYGYSAIKYSSDLCYVVQQGKNIQNIFSD